MTAEPSPSRSLAGASFSGLFWNYFGVFARNAMAFAISIPLARMLGPEPFGQVALAWSIIGLGNLLADLGFSSALVQQERLDARDIRFVFTLQIGLGLFWFLLVAGLAPQAARFFRDPGLAPVLRWLAVMFILQAAGQVATGLLKRELAFKRIQVAQAGSYLVSYLFLGLPLAWAGKGVWAIVWAQLLQGALYTTAVHCFAPHPVLPAFRAASGGNLSRFGLKVLATNLCNWTIGNIDNLMVGRWLGAVALGFYSRVFSLVTAPLNALITTLQGVLFPVYARIQERRDAQRSLYLALFEGVALLSMPVFFAVAALAPTVMVGLFGAKWTPAAPILCALASAMPFLALLGLAGPLLWGIGKVELELRAQFLVAVFSLGFLAWAARGTVIFFSWAVVALYVIRFLLMTLQIVVLLKLPLRPILRSLGSGAGLSLLGAGALWAADGALRSRHVPLPLCLGAEAALFLGAMALAVVALRRRLFGASLKWLVAKLGAHLGGAWPARLGWLFALEPAP